MADRLKSRLAELVQKRSSTGRGQFEQYVTHTGLDVSGLSPAELNSLLHYVYGSDVLAFLDQNAMDGLYREDLYKVLGPEWAELVLRHYRGEFVAPAPVNAQQAYVGPMASNGPVPFTATLVSLASKGAEYVKAYPYVAGFAALVVVGIVGGLGSQKIRGGEAYDPLPVSSASTYDFPTCSQYLGHASALRCFSANGGNSLPARSADARAAREDMARAVRQSKWRRQGRCADFQPQVDSISQHYGMVTVIEMRDRGNPTQEELFNTCSSVANREAFSVCAGASGLCESQY